MRRALLAVCAAGILATFASALDVPFLSGRVNDDAHLLDSGTAAALELKLKDYEARTGRQFAVLTVPSLQGEVLEDYSLKVARTWKLGRKDQNDGILLLVARDDRKIRFEVGYGLEGLLTDAAAGRIIRDVIVPRFRAGAFSGGVSAGVDAALAVLDGPTAAPPAPTASGAPAPPVRARFRSGADDPAPGFGMLLAALILLWFLVSLSYQLFFLSEYHLVPEFLLADGIAAIAFEKWFGLGAGPAFIGVPALLFMLRLAIPASPISRKIARRGRRGGASSPWLAFKSRLGREWSQSGYTGTGFSGGGGFFGGGSSGGGGFSGGGGSFGGGGASGSW
jgi:uncharacterized protein